MKAVLHSCTSNCGHAELVNAHLETGLSKYSCLSSKQYADIGGLAYSICVSMWWQQDPGIESLLQNRMGPHIMLLVAAERQPLGADVVDVIGITGSNLAPLLF